MREVYVTVGPSGAGKTYWAVHNFIGAVFDSDRYREIVCGDSTDQKHNNEVFQRLHKNLFNYLEKNKNGKCCFCATNLGYKFRHSFIQECRKRFDNVRIVAVVFVAPLEVCLKNIEKRSRKVPEYVVRRQISQFQIPFKNEGWDDIQVAPAYGYTPDEFDNEISNLILEFGNQDNPHHNFTLQKHLEQTMSLMIYKSNEIPLRVAAYLHDVGKIFTKVFDDKGIAHYYNHENWSAYLALCCGHSLEVATLCNYHMLPYNEQGIPTWRARLGNELWNKIMLLHECDRRAH